MPSCHTPFVSNGQCKGNKNSSHFRLAVADALTTRQCMLLFLLCCFQSSEKNTPCRQANQTHTCTLTFLCPFGHFHGALCRYKEGNFPSGDRAISESLDWWLKAPVTPAGTPMMMHHGCLQCPAAGCTYIRPSAHSTIPVRTSVR
jgi:hypothetical protein